MTELTLAQSLGFDIRTLGEWVHYLVHPHHRRHLHHRPHG
jgi:hypothetical protein